MRPSSCCSNAAAEWTSSRPRGAITSAVSCRLSSRSISSPCAPREPARDRRSGLRARPLFERLEPSMDVATLGIELNAGKFGEAERRKQRAVGDRGARPGDEWVGADPRVDQLEGLRQPPAGPFGGLRNLLEAGGEERAGVLE